MLLFIPFVCPETEKQSRKQRENQRILATMKRTADTMTWHSAINSTIDVSETVIHRDWIITFLRVSLRLEYFHKSLILRRMQM